MYKIMYRVLDRSTSDQKLNHLVKNTMSTNRLGIHKRSCTAIKCHVHALSPCEGHR